MEIKKIDVTANTIGKFSKEISDEVGKPLGTIALGQFKKYETMDMNDAHIPFHASDHIVVKNGVFNIEPPKDAICEVEGEKDPHFTGLSDASTPQGAEFDLASGVQAFDGEGNEIPFTYTPTSIAECELGEQKITYTAEGVTAERTITVTPIDEPTIHGLTELTVEVNEEFDPLDGVTATDGNGNPVNVEVIPTLIIATSFDTSQSPKPVLNSVPLVYDDVVRYKIVYGGNTYTGTYTIAYDGILVEISDVEVYCGGSFEQPFAPTEVRVTAAPSYPIYVEVEKVIA